MVNQKTTNVTAITEAKTAAHSTWPLKRGAGSGGPPFYSADDISNLKSDIKLLQIITYGGGAFLVSGFFGALIWADGKFDTVNSGFDTINTRFDSVQERLDSAATRVDAAIDGINENEVQLIQIERELEFNSDVLSTIGASIDTIVRAINEL